MFNPSSLTALLMGGGGGGAMGAPAPQPADPYAARERELMAILTGAPTQIGEVQPKPVHPLQKMLMALGSGLIAGGGGGQAGLGVMQHELGRRRQDAQMTNDRLGEQQRGKDQAKRQGAALELETIRGQREAATRAGERQEDIRLRGSERAEDRAARGEDRASRATETAAEIGSREKIAARADETDRLLAEFQRGSSAAERALRERLAKLESGENDPVSKRQLAAEQRAAAASISGDLPTLKRMAKTLKDQNGEAMTPDDVREILEDGIAANRLTDPAEIAALRKSFDQMIEPILQAHEGARMQEEAEKETKAREGVENSERRKRAREKFQLEQAIRPPSGGMKF